MLEFIARNESVSIECFIWREFPSSQNTSYEDLFSLRTSPEIFAFCLRFLDTKCQRMPERHPPQDWMLQPSMPSCRCCICGNFVKWVLVMEELGIRENRFILLPWDINKQRPNIQTSIPTPSQQWRTVTPHWASDENNNEFTMEGSDHLYCGFVRWSLAIGGSTISLKRNVH